MKLLCDYPGIQHVRASQSGRGHIGAKIKGDSHVRPSETIRGLEGGPRTPVGGSRVEKTCLPLCVYGLGSLRD